MEQLTDKQNEQLKELEKKAKRTGAKIVLIGSLRLFMMNFIVMLLSQIMMLGDFSKGILIVFTGICGLTMLFGEAKDAQVELEAKAKEILENK